MSFVSEAQRRFMWLKHPRIAEAWSHGKSSKTGKREFKIKNKGLPMHKHGSDAKHSSKPNAGLAKAKKTHKSRYSRITKKKM